jgi:hypothetical protein
VRAFAIVIIVGLCVALALGFSAALGYGASWVLSYFGVKVLWYVCSVGIFILGAIFGKGASK